MTRSIHDNDVLGYEVDVRTKTLVLRTEKSYVDPIERTDVVFTDVLGYQLCDSLGGILCSIREIDIEKLLTNEAELFAKWMGCAYPFQYCDGDPATYVRAAGAHAWDIDSAIGFYGFVVARTMTIVAR